MTMMLVPSLSRALLRTCAPLSHTLRRSFAAAASKEQLQPFEPSKWFPDITDATFRSQLTKIREIENDVLESVNQKEEFIDWAQWKKEIYYPGLVDDLKTLYDATPIPNVEEETKAMDKKIDEIFEPIVQELTVLAKESESQIADLEKRIEDLSFLRDNLAEIPIDEFLEKYPAIQKSIEEDVINNKWFVNDN